MSNIGRIKGGSCWTGPLGIGPLSSTKYGLRIDNGDLDAMCT